MSQSNQQEIVIEPESDNNMFVYTLYVIFTSQTAMLNMQHTYVQQLFKNTNTNIPYIRLCHIFDE